MSHDARLILQMTLWLALQVGQIWWVVRRTSRSGTPPAVSPLRRKLVPVFMPILTLAEYALDGALSSGHADVVYVVAALGVVLSSLPWLWGLRRLDAIRNSRSGSVTG